MNHELLIFPGMDDVSSTTNGNAKKSPNGNYTLARSFQYETFHVFNWDDYLIVSYSKKIAVN